MNVTVAVKQKQCILIKDNDKIVSMVTFKQEDGFPFTKDYLNHIRLVAKQKFDAYCLQTNTKDYDFSEIYQCINEIEPIEDIILLDGTVLSA